MSTPQTAADRRAALLDIAPIQPMSKTNAAIIAAALGAAAIFAGFDAWSDIWFVATRDEEQSHIMLAPIVGVWMAWARRIRLRKLNPQASVVGLALIVIGAIASHQGFRHAVDIAWHGGAVLMLVGAILAVFGRHIAFAVLPAFLVLVFLIPVPGAVRQTVSMPLQTATAYLTQMTLEVIGFDVERTGNMLVVQGHQIAVAEACNGMRMVWALVLVAYAFAMSIPLRNSVRLTILLLSPILALTCNVIRLVPTALLYGYGDHDVADSFHDISGWLMIPIAFCGLLGVIRLLRWAAVPVARFNLAYQ
jgi:exosortase